MGLCTYSLYNAYYASIPSSSLELDMKELSSLLMKFPACMFKHTIYRPQNFFLPIYRGSKIYQDHSALVHAEKSKTQIKECLVYFFFN